MTTQRSDTSYLPVELPHEPNISVAAGYRIPFVRAFSDAPFGFVRFHETELEYRVGLRVKSVPYNEITEVDARRSLVLFSTRFRARLAIRAPGPRRLVFEFHDWGSFRTSLQILQWAGCPITGRALEITPD